jgi:hypothetical protein
MDFIAFATLAQGLGVVGASAREDTEPAATATSSKKPTQGFPEAGLSAAQSYHKVSASGWKAVKTCPQCGCCGIGGSTSCLLRLPVKPSFN